MVKAANSIPAGLHTITPYIVVRDADKAIEFYKKAFGAEERMVLHMPTGSIMHAEIKVGDSVIMLGCECAEMNWLSPESRGGATCALTMYTNDVDAAFKKATDAGCTVLQPLADQFWGDRYGRVADPFGQVWAMATHKEDLTQAEMEQRAAEAFKQMAGAGAK